MENESTVSAAYYYKYGKHITTIIVTPDKCTGQTPHGAPPAAAADCRRRNVVLSAGFTGAYSRHGRCTLNDRGGQQASLLAWCQSSMNRTTFPRRGFIINDS